MVIDLGSGFHFRPARDFNNFGVNSDFGKCRAGLYENTPDHHAIIGGCEIENLYFANGFSGHGVMHSPAAGKALSEIMLDGKSSTLDVSCLSFSRFAKGELLHETAFI